MRKRFSAAFLMIAFLVSSGFANTTYAQSTATSGGTLQPSLEVCPIATVTQKFKPGKDCTTPLSTIEKIEEQTIPKPKKPDPTPIPHPDFTYFSSSSSALYTQNNPDDILSLINQYRASIGLTAFQKDANLCSIAVSRESQMPEEVATGTLHAGLYNRNLPYWVTENMKYGGDDATTVNWWLNSPIHHAAIVSNATYACGACVNGNTCDMLFTSYESKS